MESPQTISSPSSLGHMALKGRDDAISLTSFNPFSEEDENDQSSYALVSSLFSKVKNSLASIPLSSNPTSPPTSSTTHLPTNETRRPSGTQSPPTRPPLTERPHSLTVVASHPAPPLVSLTPVISELALDPEYQNNSPQAGVHFPSLDPSNEGYHLYAGAIPGFPIPDDARSIRTSVSMPKPKSVSKVIRKIRGEGLSRDYWMDDEKCKECSDCQSVFTAWRRKHHCRICGQIFCSRCASNIIKGAKFGQDGMIRVCNLCLEKLEKGEDDDDDDRRSVTSNMTMPYIAYPSDSHLPAHLWGRIEDNNFLFSIAEKRRQISFSSDDGSPSRPLTPDEDMYESTIDMPAPFRRPLSDEDKDSAVAESYAPTPSIEMANKAVTFPSSRSPSDPAKSSIQFPGSSPETLQASSAGSPHRMSYIRSRVNSYAETEMPTPFLRSRVQSRLSDSYDLGEPAWRQRRESTAYAQELNALSMFHLRIMLRQLLSRERVANLREWEETLLKLALQIARDLSFTSRQGLTDVRHFVKIKKIPGGAPRDSEYVDGAVITKNVAHKQMSRIQRNARVMFVTFPLDFQRVEGQYIPFGQILPQEQQYIDNLASRIASFRPHIVLVEKSVSRLALDALVQHKIAVARAVKPSAIQFVSRMTQGDVFSSIDKLALEPRLGHCGRYRIQTFDHPLIPGRRKSYMRFEGCAREMGCTIILRGGDVQVLKKIKGITKFMAFIVRNLKMETHLWKDSVLTLPLVTEDAVPVPGPVRPRALSSPSQVQLSNPFSPPVGSLSPARRTTSLLAEPPVTGTEDGVSDSVDELPPEDAEMVRVSRRIQESIESYRKTFISVSAALRFAPPQPIKKMKELDEKLQEAKRAWEDKEVLHGERAQPPSLAVHEAFGGSLDDSPSAKTPTMQSSMSSSSQSFNPDMAESGSTQALPTPSSFDTPKTQSSSTHTDDPNYFDHKLPSSSSGNSLASMRNSIGSLVAPPLKENDVNVPLPLRQETDIQCESTLSLVQLQHDEQRRVWEWYLRKNPDDFIIEKYQTLIVREFITPIAPKGDPTLQRACFLPEMKYYEFYGKNDCALGQFIETSVAEGRSQVRNSKAVCTGKSCGRPLLAHYKVYVHNDVRVSIAVEECDMKTRLKMYPVFPELITTWTECRLCSTHTPPIHMSEEVQKYSFAKFLELQFYPADVSFVPGAGCSHNVYQHHIRYFAHKGMAVTFRSDPITLREIVFPPMRIRVRPEAQLEMKNADYQKMLHENMKWYSLLIDELKGIIVEAATGDEDSDAKLLEDINALILRAEAERTEVAQMIHRVYMDSAPTDTLALNQVRRQRQDKIVAWQQDFDRLPKPKPHDKRTTTVGQGRRIPSTIGTAEQRMSSSSVPSADEAPFKRIVSDSASASETESVIGRAIDFATPADETSDAGHSPIIATPHIHDVISAAVAAETADFAAIQTPTPAAPLELAHAQSKSDPESDSTIGAERHQISPRDPIDGEQKSDRPSRPRRKQGLANTPVPHSRLPRFKHGDLVSERIRKYQEVISPKALESTPSQTHDENTDAASETGESSIPIRSKPHRNTLSSDFEQGYAANVAPRYSGGRHRDSRHTRVNPSIQSRESSRQTSPDRTHVHHHHHHPHRQSDADQTNPPTLNRRNSSLAAPTKSSKAKTTTKAPQRERGYPVGKGYLANTRPGTKRVVSGVPANKVGDITRHFERIARENRRFPPRYSVIRHAARPVASADAKVNVITSIRDESDESDAASEADDEEDGKADEGMDQSIPELDKAKAQPALVVTSVPEAEGSTSTVVVEEQETAKGGQSLEVIPEANTPSPSSVISEVVPIDVPIPPVAPSTSVSPSSVPSPPVRALTQDSSGSSPPEPDVAQSVSAGERGSLMKALSTLWPQHISQAALTRYVAEFEFDDPADDDPKHIFRESAIVVRTDEPTSIIALTLDSPRYQDDLQKFRAEKAQRAKVHEGSEAFMPDDNSNAETKSNWGVLNVDKNEVIPDAPPVSGSKASQYSFQSSGVTITCTVLYAEQFDNLRKGYGCDKSMIESLARCVKWDNCGGKSGSAFLKTKDNRFIAKELSKAELDAMETFAPAYFEYMSVAITGARPTVLAKIFGCYKITFKKTGKSKSKSKSFKMNLLVMENLFYDRRFSKIYDLKGSTRNRHVQSTGSPNEVLLDENLVQTAHLEPFYLREHSKRILRGALWNDSKFLCGINVMDYSLVVGVDNENGELVVGIVDYIRTYTWDKRIETLVKESAFLAGNGGPTVVTPELYKRRFQSAMERYFPLVPDRWMKQHDSPDDAGKELLELWPDW
ncbi:hypothetical protein SISNIDRAFT_550694 [Sistotremastrum niveocremeum HHB9708]|uniref:1-phosphatidylinositol-3-phosphate 5-kinase n=1 Tax=Sistotremastrum niveocremeum HHB9708 TaxID=1314777 RepID=A0A164SXV8_9AGAM|nr:hypothetical protein SISNIDRAFT_550694 [Sistotremastrum niveocremeum HHB9708]